MHVDADIAPRVDLDEIIADLVGDLKGLRSGAISVKDARARAEIAREIMRGFRLVIEARKFLMANAKTVPGIEGPEAKPAKAHKRSAA